MLFIFPPCFFFPSLLRYACDSTHCCRIHYTHTASNSSASCIIVVTTHATFLPCPSKDALISLAASRDMPNFNGHKPALRPLTKRAHRALQQPGHTPAGLLLFIVPLTRRFVATTVYLSELDGFLRSK